MTRATLATMSDMMDAWKMRAGHHGCSVRRRESRAQARLTMRQRASPKPSGLDRERCIRADAEGAGGEGRARTSCDRQPAAVAEGAGGLGQNLHRAEVDRLERLRMRLVVRLCRRLLRPLRLWLDQRRVDGMAK